MGYTQRLSALRDPPVLDSLFCTGTLSSYHGAHSLTLEGDSALTALRLYLLTSNHPSLFL